MSTKIILRDGVGIGTAQSTDICATDILATGVYDDRWRSIFHALGTLQVRRATEVEFNHATGEWEATHLATDILIAHGPDRSAVIQQEIAWLEAQWLERKEIDSLPQ
jgi:hypothetical protein